MYHKYPCYLFYPFSKTKKKPEMYLLNVGCFIYVTFQYMACALCFECNSDNHKGYECCPNYHKANGTCTECPAGTFGLNCSAECPENYYGRFCKKECFCRQQYCNPADGCNFKNVTANGYEFPCIQNYYISKSQCRG
nr:scavenger receptor class F member 1-like [Crassostrea gigas]